MDFFFKKKQIIVGLILTIFSFGVSLFTLSDYGINWDEPNHYIRGQAYLRFFLTGRKNYNDLPKLESHYPKIAGRTLPKEIVFGDEAFRRSIYQFDAARNGSQTYGWYLKNDFGHPPLNGILASFFNYVFYQKLGWVGDIQGYHLFIITVTSLAIFSIFLFASSIYGIFTGLVASLSIFLYPLLFSESHFNIKDPVEMSFYTLTVISFYFGITKKSWKWLLLTGITAGLALGTKLNIIFVAFTVIPWVIIYRFKDITSFKWPFSTIITISLLFIPIIALAILFGTWPYLWSNPLSNLLSFLSYYKQVGTTTYQDNNLFASIFNTYPLQWIMYITPLIVLFLTLFGIVYFWIHWKKEKGKTSLLVLFWFLVPIVRVMLPNAGIYGGVRQIMEYIPAMAILSGIGAMYVARLLNSVIFKKSLLFSQTIIILSFAPIVFKLISIHPNENVYFNPLIGGLKGASIRNFPDWGTTLGSAYKGGIDWINQNVERDSKVALIRGLLSNVPRIFIRPDIYFSESHYSGNKKNGEYLIEVVDYRWNLDIPEEKRKYIETLVPAYEEKVDDVAILRVWKNDIKHTRE